MAIIAPIVDVFCVDQERGQYGSTVLGCPEIGSGYTENDAVVDALERNKLVAIRRLNFQTKETR